MEPGKQYDVNPNQYGGKVGGCCCKIKTAWGKGSTTETPIRHANGLKRRYLFFFLFENAKNLGRSDDPERTKKRDGFRRHERATQYLFNFEWQHDS